MRTSSGSPALATTYEGRDPVLLGRILPLVGCIEVTPDSLAEWSDGRPFFPEDKLRELEEIAPTTGVLVHGVGLSIGSAEGVSPSYLEMLDVLRTAVQISELTGSRRAAEQ